MGKRRSPKFGKVASQVLRLKRLRAPKTRRNARWQIARLKAHFGRMSIRRIDEEKWIAYIAREQAKRPRKFFDDWKYMRMILLYAKRKKYIAEVPETPNPDLPTVAGRALSAKELASLERHATPNLRFQIQIAWRMGLRLGEMLRLRWPQIDLRDKVIRLEAADTKTRRPRTVPIPEILMPEFRARLTRAACQWVFFNPSLTGPVTTNVRAWRRAKEKARVRCRWQDLRCTCATVMVRKKVPIAHGAKYLGNSPTIFASRYTHPDLADMRNIARLMALPLPGRMGVQRKFLRR